MTLYVLFIGDDAPLSINAHSDDGAEILMRSCLSDETPLEARIRLTTEGVGRVLVDSTAGEILMLPKLDDGRRKSYQDPPSERQ